MDELRDQPTRRRILEAIDQHPGASARDLQHHARLGWGETAYHLRLLVEGGAVRLERGGRRDYYFATHLTWDDRRLLQALRSPTERQIMILLTDTPGLSASEIQRRIGVGKSTISFHVGRLIELRILETYYDQGARRHRLLQPEKMRPVLHTYRESFQDRVVDRFVESFGGLLP